ncbi:methylenetetrahydrofolate--tRNA-(uracil-5-)-methyltransferase [Syntrophus gentianae]|uniref:Methylenetetrahydrofolate--tRNA-(uracil-5-)-methyltransferase TrmFO n=1 Tax=Syntrophus gentianae TaxID=43775 RepID=A0A1H7W1P9_9BACT|nr:methylenetetrahydrofolate--tRNA-(uracil(54)-C(5))-methyltransferase (FADH(2)-oxidizing) TrmFO [Syntrophus gentianae]SEM15436.1 methylenetetrahydrofolate--tRNA-(uracil-5-)-methyltransferase [Syntrophus gentianae]
MSKDSPILIVGAGLAGCEAAWQLLNLGHSVVLYEMKPVKFSPAHRSNALAELVCSNSLRSNLTDNAAGLLKEEMRRMNSLIMKAADETSVPAGKALAVDRHAFSRFVEDSLKAFPRLTLIRREILDIPSDGIVIIATGPLTSDGLSQNIARITDSSYLYFYDAISPIIEGDSIDYEKVFRASRYDAQDPGDYLNCPMDKEEYEEFWKTLIEGKTVPLREFEDPKYFEGCLPIEVIASRGISTLLFGPMKPVGILNPKTGKTPYAVIQLRQENREATLFNIVGFQTKLTWPEQARIFRTIPGLEKAEFSRYGSIHRNTFINAPALLKNTLQLKKDEHIFFAGQISGVEGYIESTAMGLIAGLSASALYTGKPFLPPPPVTAMGALLNHITSTESRHFQPMNINWGLFPPLPQKVKKRERGACHALRALESLERWKSENFMES